MKRDEKFFHALGSESRLLMVKHLFEHSGECICHLSEHIGKDQSVVFRHVGILEKAGIVKTRKDGKYLYVELVDKKGLQKVIG